MNARLPAFYWKTDVSSEQPLQRGINTFDLPRNATVLEFGVFRNTQKQILDNEYVYAEDEMSGDPILKKTIFKLRVPEGNINLPRFGERDYEIDITRLNTRRPIVISSIEQVNSIQNAEVARKELIIRFNQPVPYPMYFTLTDAMNKPIGAGSPANLDSVAFPPEYLKRGVLNDPNDQITTPYTLLPAYANGFLLRSSNGVEDQWFSAVNEPYPIRGEQFGNVSFLVPVGARALKYQYTYNRLAMNQALSVAGKTQACSPHKAVALGG